MSDTATAAAGTAGRRVPADCRRPLVRWFVRPSWGVVAALLAVFASGLVPTLPLSWRLVPLAASVVVFGLPHGAVDHLALPRARGRPPTRRAAVRVYLLYGVLGAAYGALWLFAPVAAAVGFVGLTWLHWGQGDRHALTLFDGGHPDGAVATALAVLARGGLPMAVPLLTHPGVYRRVLAWFVAPFGATTAPVAWLFAPATRLWLGTGLVALTLLSLAVGYRRDGACRAWLVDAGESALLWGYFLVVPPLVSVGVYFALWHSLRHVGRLAAVDPEGAASLSAGRPAAALARFGREAAPTTALSLLLIVAAAVASPTGGAALAGVYLVVIAVLTLPHTVVVTGMDLAERAAR